MDPRKLGKKIKVARVERDLTQLQLAKKVSTFQKTISLYEHGHLVPALEAMVKIAKVLKKPLSHFVEERA